MQLTSVVDETTLDDLATIFLLPHVAIAIDAVDIEYSMWERRRAMNANMQDTTTPVLSSAPERTLPVVILGEMVALPGIYPLQLSILTPGRSNQAIRAAQGLTHEVVMIFVSEDEIGAYRTSEPQPLPALGVIARLAAVNEQPDGGLMLSLDVFTRATITARVQHDPYYLAYCAPCTDSDVSGDEIAELMVNVRTKVTALMSLLASYLSPEQIEEARTFMHQIAHPGQLADFVAYSPTFSFSEKRTILNTLDPVERLRLVERKLQTLGE